MRASHTEGKTVIRKNLDLHGRAQVSAEPSQDPNKVTFLSEGHGREGAKRLKEGFTSSPE